MTNERIVSRISDNTVSVFKGALNGEIVEPCKIQLQGLKGEFLQGGFTNISKAEGLKNAYYCDYESTLEGVKISQLKNYSKIEFAKFIDNEIDTFNAMLDNTPVRVVRDNGRVLVIANLSLLVYHA